MLASGTTKEHASYELDESGPEYGREDQEVRESVGRLSCSPLRSVVEGPQNAKTSIKHHRQFKDQVGIIKIHMHKFRRIEGNILKSWSEPLGGWMGARTWFCAIEP